MRRISTHVSICNAGGIRIGGSGVAIVTLYSASQSRMILTNMVLKVPRGQRPMVMTMPHTCERHDMVSSTISWKAKGGTEEDEKERPKGEENEEEEEK